jgi:hypothetical protein
MSTAASGSGDQPTSGTSGTAGGDDAPRKAGAFDIRVFIASLIGIYGVVLVIYGIVGSTAAEMEKTGDLNINLWAGIGMVVVAAFFITWARLRPVVVPAHVEDSGEAPRGH